METRVSRQTAIFDRGFFQDFGISSKLCSLYGKKPEDIIEVDITIAEDQNRPAKNDHQKPEHDYWAWQKTGRQDFSHAYHKFFLLDMCFICGIDAAEAVGEGKAYRVNIKQVSSDTDQQKEKSNV